MREPSERDSRQTQALDAGFEHGERVVVKSAELPQDRMSGARSPDHLPHDKSLELFEHPRLHERKPE